MMFLPRKLRRIFQPSLIDILVSLAVVGVVLVAFLAYLNPLERLRRTEDEKTFAFAEQVAGALSAYRNQRDRLPWEISREDDSPSRDNPRPRQSWLHLLEEGGFLPAGARLETNLKEYLVINLSPRKVCFYPQSVFYRQRGKYDESGVNECLPEGFTPCYICFDY